VNQQKIVARGTMVVLHFNQAGLAARMKTGLLICVKKNILFPIFS
jgi:hypothetical protein